jgi:hypothetical protein
MTPQFLADLILVLHALFVAFVVVGFALIVIGMFRHWRWIKNLWFRLAHLLAIAIVAAESWFGGICPLTEWESRLRVAAGEAGYRESFVQHWLERVVFYNFPLWVFTAAYTAFGMLVVLAWIIEPPSLSRK